MSAKDYEQFKEGLQIGHFTSNGVRLTYGQMGQGSPVVLLNGMGGNFHINYKMFLGLAESFRVTGLNYRGESGDGSDPGEVTYEDLVSDVENLLKHLSVESFHLIGFSFGGSVAQHLLPRHSEKVLSVTLISSFARRPLKWYERLLARLVLKTGIPFQRVPGRKFISRFSHCKALNAADPSLVCFACENASQTPSRALAKRALLLDSFDNRKRLKDIECPVLLIRGARDTLVPVAYFEELQEGFPHGRTEVFAETGHFPPLSRGEEMKALLLDFLSKADSKSVMSAGM
ncbi:MAG: alpha/beta hydrolase [Planctomycetota bacterium]|nr:alpha/beta hydrolase [Planctomycetota bacterium]MDA1137997.1 alpha/beta hydrolase [Planctomycetota bacterium]